MNNFVSMIQVWPEVMEMVVYGKKLVYVVNIFENDKYFKYIAESTSNLTKNIWFVCSTLEWSVKGGGQRYRNTLYS